MKPSEAVAVARRLGGRTVAIASGKGGTGKTTVAVNLALTLARVGHVLLLDGDVEAPNDHLFIQGRDLARETFHVAVPEIDESLCDACGECARFCEFNALASLGTAPMVFAELCHGCGGCLRVCPRGAVRETERRIGVIETSTFEEANGSGRLVQGRLDIGVAMAPPLIRRVASCRSEEKTPTLLDAPPGTSCPAIAAIQEADFVVLVTEPTPFGLHDLELAVETTRLLGVSFGVVVNKMGSGDDRVHAYCAREAIEILAEIPEDRRIAEAYSRGEPIVRTLPEYRPLLEALLARIVSTLERGTSAPEPPAAKPHGTSSPDPLPVPSRSGDPASSDGGSPLPNPPSARDGNPVVDAPLCEIAVISGKGGTGKTSLTASFALLAERAVVADCDVDAANLHLLLAPRIEQRHTFRSGHQAAIRTEECIGCGLCYERCRFDAIRRVDGNGTRPRTYTIDPIACEGCGVCARFCPAQAVDFTECVCGEWMVSTARSGPMVHARLGLGAENSGKLVATVRREARGVAQTRGCSTLLVDGPPGIGCPVIATVTGATMALIVTEPTVSGRHDHERALALARHFAVPAAVCVNKWDLNPEMTLRIEEETVRAGGRIAGRVRRDPLVTRAQIVGRAPVEIESAVAEDIRRTWKSLYCEGPSYEK